MKKLFILLLLPLFIACSSDDNELDPAGQKQDYTSFVIENTSKGDCKNLVAGYRLADNTLKKIENFGALKAGATSKEIKVDFSQVKEVLLFEGELSDKIYSNILILTNYKDFKLKENTKNIYTMPTTQTQLTSIKHSDATQYPQ
ncbi:MAG: hypothetical protein RL662_2127 [Bacteroidota bacterium]|jgi:hypothetical protein